ncbi:MAG: hypothetical protein PVI30_23395 [Myxococcales bacterium]|jgi:hypothetical protein
MRFVRRLVPSLILVLASACGGDDAGTSSAQCLDFQACGGDLEGDWTVEAVCFENEDALLAPSNVSGDECDDIVRELEVLAEGERSYGDDGSLDYRLALTMNVSAVWDRFCLRAMPGNEMLPINSATCTSWESSLMQVGSMPSPAGSGQTQVTAASCVLGFDECECQLTLQSEAMVDGSYEVDGEQVAEAGRVADYCVRGDSLHLSITEDGLTGNIVLGR